MTWVYAASLLLGFVALLVWLLRISLSERPAGRSRLVGQRLIAATTTFGIAGMSATFGGWPGALAVLGAAAAAGGAAVYAGTVGAD